MQTLLDMSTYIMEAYYCHAPMMQWYDDLGYVADDTIVQRYVSDDTLLQCYVSDDTMVQCYVRDDKMVQCYVSDDTIV
jgi:hypothetical protein